MKAKTSAIIATSIVAILIAPTMAAFANPYLGNVGVDGEAPAHTLEEALRLQSERVSIAQESGDKGSGTPIIAADGAVGASLIAGAVFGGLSLAFVVQGRKGRYAKPGMG